MCSKVDDYLATRADKVFEFHKTIGEKSDSYERRVEVKLPTVEGFALFINVNKTTLYEWREKHTEFSNSLEKIVEEQRKRLLDKGLSGEYNPTIAKLILSSNHNMREKADLTTDGDKIESPIYGGKSKD